MKPISEFPYGDVTSRSNPMHERLLLLQMESSVSTHFNFGYYDVVNDVFQVCSGNFINTPEHTYESRILDNPYDNMSCMMPDKFTKSVGPRRIRTFMEMGKVLESMETQAIIQKPNAKELEKFGYLAEYLVCTVDNKLFIANVGCFVDHGKRFGASWPDEINGHVCHAKGPVPLHRIKWAVDLLIWKDIMEKGGTGK